jgi:hypothetical protein
LPQKGAKDACAAWNGTLVSLSDNQEEKKIKDLLSLLNKKPAILIEDNRKLANSVNKNASDNDENLVDQSPINKTENKTVEVTNKI